MNMSNAFLGSFQDSKNQTTPYEPHTQALVDHVLVCGIMWQIEPIFYVFTNQPCNNLLQNKLPPFASISSYIFVVLTIIANIPFTFFLSLHIFFILLPIGMFME